MPSYMSNLGGATVVSHLPAHLNPWERFGVEFILTFVVVFTYFVSMDTYRKWLGSSALSIGSAYLACTLVSTPSMNPARTLGPAFVMNKWDNHWVSGHYKHSSSIHSDEDPYDELEKPAAPKFHGSAYNTLRGADIYRPAVNHGGPPTPASPTGPGNAYCPSLTSASLYSAPPCKLDRVESLYGGTKSLYAKSPPLTRANLNRSQSVYSKVPTGPVCARDGLSRPGPLVPAQSLYPMRFTQNHNTTNQNVQNQQNQLQQRSESIYGVRGIANVNRGESGGVYGVSHGNNAVAVASNTAPAKFAAGSNRPESMYGMVVNRRQDSADSSYSSYHSGATGGNGGGSGGAGVRGNGTYGGNKCAVPPPQGFSSTRNDMRQSPQTPQHQLLSPAPPSSIINTTNSVASYHHNQRLSPNPQY
ncbi:hypothetical protein C0J52_11690 [Blattella germanica]|nr:hypothetical protein C0J52_11690 [Blattella germanica]